MDQDPLGEAQGLAQAQAHLDRLAVGDQAQEAGRGVLGGAELAGGQADHDAVVQPGVAVGAGGQGHGALAGAPGAGGQDPAGGQDGRGLLGRQGAVLLGAHWSLPSSMIRPAYSAAAIRMPSDHATGPTSAWRSARPSSSCQVRAPVSLSSS